MVEVGDCYKERDFPNSGYMITILKVWKDEHGQGWFQAIQYPRRAETGPYTDRTVMLSYLIKCTPAEKALYGA